MSRLYIPELDSGASMDEAGRGYAAAGWYVLPIDPATKHAGSVLGKGWPAKSTRDVRQIVAWFAGGTHYGLALHIGRSGAIAFDVDHPDEMPLVLADNIGALSPPHQSSRAETGRGHYLFAAPAGRNYGNGTGKLRGGWGEVRGRNGILVAFPTPHSSGGKYVWLQTGPLPELPAELDELLPVGSDADAAATDAETAAFLVGHATGTRLDLAETLFDRANERYREGVSRHETFVDIVAWAMREVAAGLYPAPSTVDRLRRLFITLMGSARRAGERSIDQAAASAEFAGILSWAVAQAKMADPEITRRGVDARLAAPTLPIVGTSGRLVLTPASMFTPTPVRWGWQDRMPVGELTLIPGREGIGKSLFLAWLAAQLTRGTLEGEFLGTPRAVLYVASEDSWQHTITPRLLAADADTALVYRVDPNGGGKIALPGDCAALAEEALGVQAAAIMLDPVISLIDDRLSVNQGRELRQALEPLRLVAEAGGLMVNALAHFNKANDVDVLSKIPGSRAWAEVARAAFGLAQDDEEGTFVGSQIKNNLGRLDLPHRTYKIEETPVVMSGSPVSVARLVWTGHTERGVQEVLGRSKADTAGRPVSLLSQEIITFVESRGYAMTVADIHAEFPDEKRNSVRRALGRAAERGLLTNPVYGHYGPRGQDPKNQEGQRRSLS